MRRICTSGDTNLSRQLVRLRKTHPATSLIGVCFPRRPPPPHPSRPPDGTWTRCLIVIHPRNVIKMLMERALHFPTFSVCRDNPPFIRTIFQCLEGKRRFPQLPPSTLEGTFIHSHSLTFSQREILSVESWTSRSDVIDKENRPENFWWKLFLVDH